MFDMSNSIDLLVTLITSLFTDLFLTIPGKFIALGLGSGPLFTVFHTIVDNQNIQKLVFLLIIAGGPLMVSMQWANNNNGGRNRIANRR